MSKGRVLQVEDNPDDIELSSLAFKEGNFPHQVDIARDGQEALDFLAAARDLPVLVLLDLNLPKIGGLEVLRRVRADPRLKMLRVVVLSGSDEPTDKKEAQRLGVERFFTKPVGLDGFVKIVQELEGLLSRRAAP